MQTNEERKQTLYVCLQEISEISTEQKATSQLLSDNITIPDNLKNIPERKPCTVIILQKHQPMNIAILSMTQ